MISENTVMAIMVLFLLIALLLFFLRETVCRVTILGQTIAYTVHAQGEKSMRSKLGNL